MVSPTSQDVAKQARVSIATVSRVLNNSVKVSPAIRRRVLRVVKELNYQPNRTAQRLRAKRSRVIGIIISDIQNPFFTSVVRGIEDVAYREGYSVVLCNSDEDPKKERLYINVMRAESVAGVIVASTSESAELEDDLLQHNIPVVAIDREIKSQNIDSVLAENENGAFDAVSHLVDLGHREIGFISLPLTHTPGKERYNGYRRALKHGKLSATRDYVKFSNAKQLGGYQSTLELLAKHAGITALFVANNLMALGALDAIRERGLNIPNDISIISFDDTPWARLLQPPLSAVAQPTYDLGTRAAELLFERLEHPQKPADHQRFKTTLLIRGSTGSPKLSQTSNNSRNRSELQNQ